MKRRSSAVRIGAVIALCALGGAAAGIAGSAAAPSSKAKKANSGRRVGPLLGHRGGPAVHANAVVLNKAGNGFITVTEDSGKVKSLSGGQLTITEGVGNVTYKDVSLTISSNVTVVRNYARSQLSVLHTGDFVHVSQSLEGTFVVAEDVNFRNFERNCFGGLRGYGGPGVPHGGPPGEPPA